MKGLAKASLLSWWIIVSGLGTDGKLYNHYQEISNLQDCLALGEAVFKAAHEKKKVLYAVTCTSKEGVERFKESVGSPKRG